VLLLLLLCAVVPLALCQALLVSILIISQHVKQG
jgi:hypothetical protein